jgi:hypothetical protein
VGTSRRLILVGAAALILGVLIGAAAYALLINNNSTATRHFNFAQIALPGDTAKTPATYRDVTVHYRSNGTVARIELKGCKTGRAGVISVPPDVGVLVLGERTSCSRTS